MKRYHELYKNFVDKSILNTLVDETKAIIQQFYDTPHLKEHSAYFADKKAGRESYAFNVWSASETCPLSAISTDAISEFASHVAILNESILEYLKIDTLSTRLLFNVQIYYQSSSPVARHFDGELQAFTVKEDGTLVIKDAIRPRSVAVLTLVNHTEGGGTRLFYPNGETEVIRAQAGDLLVLDNVECDHGADSFEALGKVREDGIVRMTIGWRSLDRDCVLWKNGKIAHSLSYDEANAVHREWLENEWPKMYEAYQLSEQKVAF